MYSYFRNKKDFFSTRIYKYIVSMLRTLCYIGNLLVSMYIIIVLSLNPTNIHSVCVLLMKSWQIMKLDFWRLFIIYFCFQVSFCFYSKTVIISCLVVCMLSPSKLLLNKLFCFFLLICPIIVILAVRWINIQHDVLLFHLLLFCYALNKLRSRCLH